MPLLDAVLDNPLDRAPAGHRLAKGIARLEPVVVVEGAEARSALADEAEVAAEAALLLPIGDVGSAVALKVHLAP